VFAHSGLNLFDDYFDYKKGAVQKRQELQDGGMRARMGKCAYLQGDLSIKNVAQVGALFVVVALAIGVVVTFMRGWPILVFAGVTLLLGMMYAGPPLRLSYHGFGELVVGIIFGPLVVIAAYYVALGSISALAVWASVPAGLLTINILNAHAIMDFESDKAADRITFVLLLGSKQAGFVFSCILVALSYVAVIIAVILGAFSLVSLAVLITLPMAIAFLKLLHHYLVDPMAPVEAKAWMGPLGEWDKIKAAGIDWFMIRWLLARNLLMAFVLLLAITNFIPVQL
jgi:1,4-dihydroxy-2-naphthoate octaprenyltransferase